MEEIIIETHTWTGPEYNHKPRGNDWFWTIGLIAVAGFITTLFFQSYVFGIFILVSGFSLIFFGLRAPQEVTFEINQQGMLLAGKEYIWKKIKGFKIQQDKNKTILLIEVEQYFLPVFTLPLPAEDKQYVRDTLIQMIPELDLKESPSMVLMEKLGF